MTEPDSALAKPFLKWAGGKRQILPELHKSFPVEFEQFHEPFVGGGAVFFNLLPRTAVLSDANKELIGTYNVVKNKVEALIGKLEKHIYDKEYFYRIRAQDPTELSPVARAARMIYLNRAGFNGLYRVNSKGQFNVPFGRYKNPRICNAANLRACSAALAPIDVKCASFETVLRRAKPGDFVYFDPPYIPVSGTANFTAYQKNGFGMANQEKLAEVFDKLTDQGIQAMLSNADVPWIHERYRRHAIRVIKARRNVNSNAERRGHVGEVVVTNYR